jgi:hypothetical protein
MRGCGTAEALQGKALPYVFMHDQSFIVTERFIQDLKILDIRPMRLMWAAGWHDRDLTIDSRSGRNSILLLYRY